MRFFIFLIFICLFSCESAERQSNEIASEGINPVSNVDTASIIPPKPSIKKVSQIGIVIADSVNIVDSNNRIQKTLYFGETFRITEVQNYQACKVLLFDSSGSGWIRDQVRIISVNGNPDSLQSSLPTVYYTAGRRLTLGGYHWDNAKSNAMLLFEKLLSLYPESKVTDYEEEFCNLRGRTAAYYGLAMGNLQIGNTEKSIEYYDKFINDPFNKDNEYNSLHARYNLISCYEALMDKKRLFDYCHYLIKSFPQKDVQWFEGSTKLDESAAYAIYKSLTDSLYDANLLRSESDKIISESKNPQVQFIGYQGKIYRLLKEGKYAESQQEFETVFRKFSNETFPCFNDNVELTPGMVNIMINLLLKETGDYNKTISYTESLKKKAVNDSAATLLLNYKLVELYDEGFGDIQKLNALIENLERKGFYCNNYHYQISERSKIFSSAETESEEAVVTNACIAKPGLKASPKFFTTISQGARVKVLYREENAETENGVIGYWTKIKTDNDSVYWVFDAYLKFNRAPLQAKITANSKYWSSQFSDVSNSGFVPAALIQKPVIKRKLKDKNIPTLFSDMNNDSYLDIVSHNFAIDGKTEKLLWRIDQQTSVPVVSDNAVYYATNYSVFCVNKETGKTLWSTMQSPKYTNAIFVAPFVDDKQVYFGSYNNEFIVLNKFTGEIIKKIKTGTPIRTAPVKCKDLILFLSAESHETFACLYAYDCKKERIVWKYNFPFKDDPYRTALVIKDDLIFHYGNNGCIYAIDMNGKLQWKTDLGCLANTNCLQSKPLLVNNQLVVAKNSNTITCLDATTGKTLWEKKIAGNLSGGLSASQHQIFIPLYEDKVISMDLKGNRLWELKMKNNTVKEVIIADNLLYVFDGGDVYIVGESSKVKKN